MACLYLVLPCYNEEEILPDSILILIEKLEALKAAQKIDCNSKILFVDDGSKDGTWNIIEQAQINNDMIAGIQLSRNEGHQKALLAGMLFAKNYADIVITLDADLQQDIESLDLFIDKYEEGYEIIYGKRKNRKADGFLKKITAKMFYFIMDFLQAGNHMENCADYRLMSKRVIHALENYQEVNLYLRGMIPLIGFNSTTVYFDVKERKKGTSKYTIGKMTALALDGITSFSIQPVRLITLIGLCGFVSSIIMLIYIITAWIRKIALPGWTSMVTAVWVLGGLQLLAIGIVGEYVAKTYLESKRRPRYHIDRVVFKKTEFFDENNKKSEGGGTLKTSKIERQKQFFNSISDEYIKARKNNNHLYYKKQLWKYILSNISNNPCKCVGGGKKRFDVLDMMCGSAEGEEIVKNYISADYAYTGFDYSEKMIENVKNRYPNKNVFVQDVVTYVPNKKYDMVMIIGGLHHVPFSLDLVLCNVFDSLKPGAVFINFEPTNNNRIYKNIRNMIYKKNHIFDEQTERAFELNVLNNSYYKNGFELIEQYHVGLLAYILYYNPDAFPALNIGNKRLVKALQKLDTLFYKNMFGRKLSFATFSVLRRY